MRDLLKTIGAIVVIGLIVIATFLYGNKQRQEQLRRDQQTAQEQQKTEGPAVTVDKSQNNTEVKPENAKPSPAPAPAPAASNVGGGTTPATTPETGGELYFLLPVALVAGLYQVHRSSKKNLRQATESIRIS